MFFLCLGGTVYSKSVTSCGAAGDHLSNVQISLSPDPIKRGSKFTFNVSGDLDETFDAGNIDVDLKIGVMGVKKSVKTSVPITYSPGILKGPLALMIGPAPFNFPKVPGLYVGVTGTVKLTNAKKEQVACIKLNMRVGANEEVAEAAVAPTLRDDPPVRVCGSPKDHMQKFAFHTDSQGVSTVTGTLDEDVDKLKLVAALDIKIPGNSTPPIDMNIPVSMSHGILRKGDFKITAGVAKGVSLQSEDDPVSVTGTLKAYDGKSEEILCLEVSTAPLDAYICGSAGTCVADSRGAPLAACQTACGGSLYSCANGQCVADPKGSSLKACQAVCGGSLYTCVSGKCESGPSGVPLKTCQGVCGGFAGYLV
jgi:hypothetical protein